MNTEKTTSRWIYLVLLLAFIVLACIGIRTISHRDIWMHLAAGRTVVQNGIPKEDVFSYTASDAPWTNVSWLYDSLLYRLWNLGGPALATLVHVITVLLAFAALVPAVRKWSGALGISFALLLSAWLLAPQFVVGPALFGLLFAALFIAVLEADLPQGIRLAVLIPCQILWTNMHVSFLVGPAIAAVYAVQAWIDARNPETAKPRSPVPSAILAGALILVTLVNPYGIGAHREAIAVLVNPAFTYVATWMSPYKHQFLPTLSRHFVTAALLIGAGGLIAQRRRLPIAITALAVITAFLVVRSLRYGDFFAILAFPFLCLSFGAIGEFIIDKSRSLLHSSGALVIGAVAAVALCVFSLGALASNAYYLREGSPSTLGFGAVEELFPKQAQAIQKSTHFPEKALNLVQDGGYIAWTLPGRQIFADERATVYGRDFYEDLYGGLLRGDPEELETMLAAWDPGAILLNMCTRHARIAARNILLTGRWALVYFDGTTAIFMEPGSHYAAALADGGMRQAGLAHLDEAFKAYKTRLEEGSPAPVPSRLVGAANLFLSLNRFREAAAIYAALTRGAPAMTDAWRGLGICQLQMGEAARAVESLEQARDMQPKDARTWLLLSRAYAGAGMTREAEFAFAEGAALNPSTAEAFGNPTEEAEE